MRTTIEMAREAGIRDCTCNGTKGCLERFASLVRADERARMATDKSKEAMRLALEALELCNGAQTAEGVVVYTDKEITALRQALANEALDKKAENARELGLDYEPRRWAVFCQGCRKEWSVSYPHPGKSICADCDDKLAGQPAQQEPVAYWIPKAKQFCLPSSDGTRPFAKAWEPLYTSPPAQRTWVGLTDAERKLVRNSVGYNQFVTAGEYAEHVQKATEFKLREKNNG